MRRGKGIGFLILIAGLLYLLIQMNVIPGATHWTSPGILWPLILAGCGVYGLFESRWRKIPWTSFFLILFGVGLAVKHTARLPWLNHIGAWSLFFGLAVMLFGLSLILPGRRWFTPVIVLNTHRDDIRQFGNDGDEGNRERPVYDAELVDIDEHFDRKRGRGRKRRRRGMQIETDWRIIGDVSLGKSAWVLRNMHIWNGIGDVRVNLATAHIEEGTYRVNVRGWIGDIRILVPEDLPVCVDAEVSVGNVVVFGDNHSGTGRSIHAEDPAYSTATRRVRLQLGLRVGDVEVVRV